MLLGIYNAYLCALSSINLPVLIPLGLGLILGALIFLKIIEFLFEKFYLQTYYSIIGFVCGSVFILYEPIGFDFNGIIAILCFAFGFVLSQLFDK